LYRSCMKSEDELDLDFVVMEERIPN